MLGSSSSDASLGNFAHARPSGCSVKHQSMGWDDICCTSYREETLKAVESALDEAEDVLAERREPVMAKSSPSKSKVPREAEVVDEGYDFNDSETDVESPAVEVYANSDPKPKKLKKPSRPFWHRPTRTTEPSPRHVHTFSFDAEPFYYNYKDQDQISSKGYMLGYNAEYAYRPLEGSLMNTGIVDVYGVSFHYASGDLDFKTSSFGSIPDKRNSMFEVRGLLGKDIALSEEVSMTPYLGIGYRSLLDEGNLRVTTSSFYYYDRHSRYTYLPLGINASAPLGPLSADVNLEWDIFLKGTHVSDWSIGKQFSSITNPNVSNKQKDGFGLRGSIRFSYMLPNKLNIYAEPFVRYWKIKASDTKRVSIDGSLTNISVPTNRTTEIGSKFGLIF